MSSISAIECARTMVVSGKYRETNGPNRSPAIDSLCREFGVPLGSSWCALFASKAFRDSLRSGSEGTVFKYTAGSQSMLAWFRKMGWTSDDPQDLLDWSGALIIRTDPGGEHGHVAMVEKRFTSNGVVVALGTLEGNTDKNGGSNGDGAYERKRIIPLKPYKWTYCNTTHIAGGQWWQ